MYNEITLRDLAGWRPIPPTDEVAALTAARSLVEHITREVGVAAFVNEGSYENFTPVYVYLPVNVSRHQSGDSHVRSTYECLVLYFSHLVPLAALGSGSWGETQDNTGRVTARGYSGLDTPALLDPEQLPDGPMKERLIKAIAKSGYTVALPSALLAPAPSWFEPLQRSEGAPPWNRIFHLLFQFRD